MGLNIRAGNYERGQGRIERNSLGYLGQLSAIFEHVLFVKVATSQI